MKKILFFERFIEARPELVRTLGQRMQYADAEDCLQDACVYWLEKSYWRKVKSVKVLDALFWKSAIKTALDFKRAADSRKAREQAFHDRTTELYVPSYLELCSKFSEL